MLNVSDTCPVDRRLVMQAQENAKAPCDRRRRLLGYGSVLNLANALRLVTVEGASVMSDDDVSIDELREAVERMHGVPARFVGTGRF
jgi:hypothetical protein